MKTKILVFTLCTLLFALCALPGAARPKKHLPFATKFKMGKLRTKQAKPQGRKEAWIYKQWGLN